jgi:hypothetical protein
MYLMGLGVKLDRKCPYARLNAIERGRDLTRTVSRLRYAHAALD